MRLQAIGEGGRWRTDPIEVELMQEDGQPCDPPVIVRLIPVPPAQMDPLRRRAMVSDIDPDTGRASTQFSPPMFELEYFTTAIVGWSGIEDTNGNPIPEPTRDAVGALIIDPHYKRQLDRACFRTEAAVSAESFRESPDVVSLVS